MDPSTATPTEPVLGPATPPIIAPTPAPAPQNSVVEILGTFLTIGLLVVFFPLGLIVMWLFTKWPKILKILLTIFFLLIAIPLVLVGYTIINSSHSVAGDVQRRTDIQTITKALEEHFDPQTGQYLPPQSNWFAGGKIPTDPSGKSYQGIPVIPTSQFTVCATLDNATLPSAPKDYCTKSQR